MREIRWGMIGCGNVTEEKNGPGLYKASYSKLVGITNRTLSKAHNWVRRHGHGKVYNSPEDLFADDSIDIVYIATPPDSHLKYALMCAEAQKHCYLEKPIGLSYKEGVKIFHAFNTTDRKIWVAHYRRGMKRYLKLKELLKDDVIGKILAVDIIRAQKPLSDLVDSGINLWQLDSNISGGGAFYEGDIHMLDLIDYLFGEAIDVQIHAMGNEENYKIEKIVSLNMVTRDHIHVNGLWCYHSSIPLDNFRIVGSKGVISFSYGDNDGPIRIITEKGEEEVILKEHENVGTGQIQLIVNELLNNGCCESTIESALRSLKIAEEVIKECKKQYNI